jgi:signal transduction histidine kinase
MADSIKDMITKLSSEKEKQKYFFDNFTHEIRTPLTTILGYTELLWKTNDEEVRDKSLFYITSEGKRMLKMMERLLELSKLKNYSFELNKSDSNLKKLIEDACDSMQYKMKRYNITFRLNLEDITWKVDPDLFKQGLINIVDNCIKYSKSTIIDISLRYQEVVKLEITDYGCGIDLKNLESVFDPYYKVDQSRNSKIEGWGLGLSIVKEIIDKHGGSIEIMSTPQKGTSIIITLD